jgi:GNAT superfamily N-acetyltransferase
VDGDDGVRRASVGDATEVAALLHDFNLEFETPTPGVAVLTARLCTLLDSETTIAYLAGRPAQGVAVLTVRANVWYPGPVVLLDELYVIPALRGQGIGAALLGRAVADAVDGGVSAIEINVDEFDTRARRFYERHGFAATEQGSEERALYYFREL